MPRRERRDSDLSRCSRDFARALRPVSRRDVTGQDHLRRRRVLRREATGGGAESHRLGRAAC
eukprot:768430-Hanusia_phi.AAC.2